MWSLMPARGPRSVVAAAHRKLRRVFCGGGGGGHGERLVGLVGEGHVLQGRAHLGQRQAGLGVVIIVSVRPSV